jgi:hypothetical protein
MFRRQDAERGLNACCKSSVLSAQVQFAILSAPGPVCVMFASSGMACRSAARLTSGGLAATRRCQVCTRCKRQPTM